MILGILKLASEIFLYFSGCVKTSIKTMRITKFLLVAVIAGLLSVNASAQKDHLVEANQTYEAGQYFEAITLMKKAYSKEKDNANKADIIYKTAECYRYVNDMKQAETWYRKAIKIKYPENKIQLYYADALKANGKFEDAIVEYEKYAELVPDDPRGKNGAEACALAQKWIDNPSRYVVENEVQLNGKQMDFSPNYASSNHKEIYFTSSRNSASGGDLDGWTGQGFTDIFSATIDNKGKWSKPKPLPATISSIHNEGAAVMNADYTEMIFTRCGLKKKVEMGCELYHSKKEGSSWTEPEMLPFFLDSVNNDSVSVAIGHPALSADGKKLVFASDIETGKGGRDLWMSTYNDEKARWGAPVNLDGINTAGDERYPFIHNDGTLYFSSNGHIGIGGDDIFMAEAQGDVWGNVINMRYPINSSGDDFGIIFEKEQEKGYFSSNREDGKGSDDIYSFLLPALKFTLCGTVSDFKTKMVVNEATVSLVGTDGSSMETTTDSEGKYCFDLSPATSYVITAGKKDEYLNKTGKTTTVGFEEDKDLIHDFELDPINRIIDLPNIFYDLGKWDLRPESKIALDGLVETLNDNPTIVVELGSHTDTRASDSYNLSLSQKRAQSVVDYLIDNDVSEARLVAKGYGETTPKVLDNAVGELPKGSVINDAFIATLSGEELKEEAHQLNRRTEFKVLRNDYVPKGN
ncbi:MAG: peptidoglycan-associated lipoprotein [Bacteroidia bacterium]|jgi:peptidoglycan-associated lipoprotein